MEASNGHHQGPPRKKARKGKKKSKAERLSRGLTLTTTASENHNDDALTVSVDALATLLAAPEATTSTHWDRAQALAMRLGTTEARQLLVRSLVFDRQAHRAAVHYARRLQIPQDELTAVLVEGRDDPSKCLAVARFLTDADTSMIDHETRLNQFVVHWLDAHKTTSAALNDDDQPTVPSAFATAARLVLQPNAVHKKPSVVAEKLALQRLLVTALLAQDETRAGHGHAGVVLQYASSLASVLQDAMAADREGATADPTASWSNDAWDVERQRRLAIASRVEELLTMLWPDARVHVFGSSATALLLPTDETASPTTSHDDVDLCVVLPSCPQFLDDTAPLVADIKDHFALYLGETSGALAVTRARVPIVKWTDPESQLQCDLCVNNLAALWNTQLTMQLIRDPIVHTVSRWIKRWYKTHCHRNGFAAGISSYGMQLLVFYFLQHSGVVPSRLDCGPLELNTEELQKFDLMSEIDAKVSRVVAASTASRLVQHKSLWALVVGFFAFYGANTFDFEHGVVSLRGAAVTKSDKQWTRRNWRFSLSIEDPIETDRDLGSLFSRVSLTRFRTALVAACVKIAQAHAAKETKSDQGRTRVLEALLADSTTQESHSK